MEFQSAAGFLGTIANTLDYDKGKFYLKLTGGFGGTITSLPAKNTQEIRVNIDGLPSGKGLRIATTTIPTPIKEKVVFYSDTKDSLSAGDVLMTFPSGTAVDPSAFTVKFATGVSAAGGEVATKSVLNGDGTISLVVVQSDWTGEAGDGKFSTPGNWLGNVVPAEGRSVYIGVDVASTLVCDIDFRPSAITFMASSAAITIDGSGAISGITTITNLSSVSHTINAPVYFTSGINVKQNAVAYDTRSYSHVTLAGGAYAAPEKTIDAGYSVVVFGKYYFANTTEWTATEEAAGTRKTVAANSYLYIPLAGDMNNLYVGKGATIDIGKVTHSVSNNRLSWRNYGEMVVTNLTFTASGDRFVTSHQTDGTGTFKFEAVTNSMTGNWFYLGDATEAGNHVFYIGEGGMQFANASGTPCFSIGCNYAGNTETVRPWYSDFTIADRSGGDYSLVFYRNVTFCTDDENGDGRTITIDARTRGNGEAGTLNITVSGSGKVKVNGTSYNATQPAVTVKDTATLAIKPGAGLGESAMTVNTGATLAVEESADVTISGATDLKDGAVLSFNFTSIDAAPKFVFSNTATASGTVKVKVSAADGVFPRKLDGKWLIAEGVSGTFELDEGNRPTWADGVSVEGSNLYLDVKAPGLTLSVR